MPSQNKTRWLVLVLVLLTTGIGIMIFAAPFPLLNLWVKYLKISRTEAGALTGLWYLAFACASLPFGLLADRMSLRRLFLVLWTLIVVGTALMAVARGYWVLCLGRAVFSAGMVGHVVAAPKLLAIWFEGRREFGLIMGLFSMSMTGGVYASLFFLGRIGQRSGWRPAMLILVWLAVCGLFALMFVPSSHPNPARTAPAVRSVALPLSAAVWVLAIAYAGYNVATEAYLTFTPDYLVRHGYGLAAASAMVGIYAWVALSLKPFLSFFLRKNNAAIYLLTASAIFILSVALLIARAVSPAVSAGLLGISMALGMPALYALPPLMFGNERAGRVYGLCGFLYGIGFLVQPLVGFTVDKTGRYTSGYAVISCVAGFALFGALWLSRNAARAAETAALAQSR